MSTETNKPIEARELTEKELEDVSGGMAMPKPPSSVGAVTIVGSLCAYDNKCVDAPF